MALAVARIALLIAIARDAARTGARLPEGVGIRARPHASAVLGIAGAALPPPIASERGAHVLAVADTRAVTEI